MLTSGPPMRWRRLHNHTATLPDVQIGYGPNADPAVVSAGMVDLVKDSLREAGQTQATITSTVRTPEDQARAMFNNLTNPANTTQQNIAIQRGIHRSSFSVLGAQSSA